MGFTGSVNNNTMKPDKKFNDLDPVSAQEALEWFQWLSDRAWGKTKEECRAALRKSNPICCWSNGKYRISSSGYLDAIRMF